MATKRPIIAIDESLCNGCGNCIIDCAEGAIALIDGKAKVISDNLCDGLGACIGNCPTGALTIITRTAVPFDPQAVEKHLASQGITHAKKQHHPQGCPSLQRNTSLPMSNRGAALATQADWPLKLQLLTPDNPRLQGAHILLAADCAAAVIPSFQAVRANHVLILACPKLEGKETLESRLAAIFQTAQPASCTVLRMEVPCCQRLTGACLDAKKSSGNPVIITEQIISLDGTWHK